MIQVNEEILESHELAEKRKTPLVANPNPVNRVPIQSHRARDAYAHLITYACSYRLPTTPFAGHTASPN